jgi:hypothetical protein
MKNYCIHFEPQKIQLKFSPHITEDTPFSLLLMMSPQSKAVFCTA